MVSFSPRLSFDPAGVRTFFQTHFAAFRWTIAPEQFQGVDVVSMTVALDQVRTSAKTRAPGVRWFRSPPRSVVKTTEDGHYDPNDNSITLLGAAFTESAERMGTYARGQFTVAHELGHALSNLDSGAKAAFDKAAKGTEPITDVGATTTEENFAECFALFSALPSELAALRPGIFDFFDKRYR